MKLKEKLSIVKANYAMLPKKKKILLISSIAITVALLIEIPVYAWFSSQRKMAVLGNINAPYTLYLSSGNQESLMWLDMSSIDVGVPGSRVPEQAHKDYVFSVQGSWDINDYYLQLAHTTNIPFKYSVYRVKNEDIYTEAGYNALSDELKATSVPYTTHNANGKIGETVVAKGETIYYTFHPDSSYSHDEIDAQYGKIMDESNYKNIVTGQQVAANNDTYYSKTYASTNNAKVQKNAVPLYMQAGPIKAGASNGEEFCDYYVLRVDWSDATSLQNEKETDMVYITVVTPSVVTQNNASP